MSNYFNPVDCNPPDYSVHGILEARILERVPFPSPGNLPDPGIEFTSLFLLNWQVGSLPLANLLIVIALINYSIHICPTMAIKNHTCV